mmetsp:Transcript_7699/g.15469  ORF Transcript_7699/g.15469 Transcript_7699/m.15469 type:complete len:117 (+) Transcript_7699:1295-1645(+)
MLGVRFLKEVAGESTVVDPFCGVVRHPSQLPDCDPSHSRLPLHACFAPVSRCDGSWIQGTIPAAANVVGMSSVGVDLSPPNCELSRRMRLEEALRIDPSAEEAYRGDMPKLQSNLQ